MPTSSNTNPQGVSYAINNIITNQTPTAYHRLKINQIKKTSQTMLLIDSMKTGSGLPYNADPYNIQPYDFSGTNTNIDFRHLGRTSFMLVDGHASSSDMKTVPLTYNATVDPVFWGRTW